MIRRIALLTIAVPLVLAGCKSPASESLINQADEFLKYDQYSQAARAVEPVVRDHPGNWRAQLAYGRALMGEGDLEGARRALDRAHSLQSDNGDAVFALATCQAKQGDSAAAYQLLRGYGRDFHSWRAYATLSTIAEQVGDADTALQAADDAIKVNDPVPGQKMSTEPYLRAAEVSFKYGREEAGVRRLRQAYGINPDDPRVSILLREHNVQPGKAIALPPGV
ncbi:MAG: tetratricopeptide repeat protein [Phycisphaerae bacterium]|nr:tetratricopeptide repeat protein [Phycisphaerae bacterium]